MQRLDISQILIISAQSCKDVKKVKIWIKVYLLYLQLRCCDKTGCHEKSHDDIDQNFVVNMSKALSTAQLLLISLIFSQSRVLRQSCSLAQPGLCWQRERPAGAAWPLIPGREAAQDSSVSLRGRSVYSTAWEGRGPIRGQCWGHVISLDQSEAVSPGQCTLPEWGRLSWPSLSVCPDPGAPVVTRHRTPGHRWGLGRQKKP